MFFQVGGFPKLASSYTHSLLYSNGQESMLYDIELCSNYERQLTIDLDSVLRTLDFQRFGFDVSV